MAKEELLEFEGAAAVQSAQQFAEQLVRRIKEMRQAGHDDANIVLTLLPLVDGYMTGRELPAARYELRAAFAAISPVCPLATVVQELILRPGVRG